MADSAHGNMRVPAILYAPEDLILGMDDKVYEQLVNVTTLPGIVKAAYAMPDAHWGYGFPIGGVAAFDAEAGGVVSAGGVGFDISCGVRTLTTGLQRKDIDTVKRRLADTLFERIPAGLGSTGILRLNMQEMDNMLKGGARWAVGRGYGDAADLERTKNTATCRALYPARFPSRPSIANATKWHARFRQSLSGSSGGQRTLRRRCRLRLRPASGRCRGQHPLRLARLGHQIGTDYLKLMAVAAPDFGIHLPDRELACAPLTSSLGQDYLGAMRAGINCALANRQILTHLTRAAFATVLPKADLRMLYDVSHNTCKEETHVIDGRPRRLFVHRKGATRAFAPVMRTSPRNSRRLGSRS